MAYADVTAEYVDLLTGQKYSSRTGDITEFDTIKQMQSQYLNPNKVPDKKYTHGLALLVAHFYALDDANPPDQGGSDKERGPITSESVGGVSIGYGGGAGLETISGMNAYLAKTRFGTEFIYLMKTFKCTPLVTG